MATGLEEDVTEIPADDLPEEQTETRPKPTGEAESFPEDVVIFDIETGPRPWEEIEEFFEPPEHPGPFDQAKVKVGNLKDPDKIRAKIQEASDKHELAVQDWSKAIETAKAEFMDEAALSPITGQLLAIGWFGEAGPEVWGSEKVETELQMLICFWSLWQEADSLVRFLGFNIFGFDLPFLIRRSWFHGIEVPRGVLSDNRYWSKVFIDLMQVWSCASREMVRLDKLAAFFGVERKSGSGADFHKLWNDPDKRGEAIEYLKTDLRVTLAVARKLGVC